MTDYRQFLVKSMKSNQAIYDRAILIGSGSGMALMTLRPEHSSRVAFVAWAFAITFMLVSFDTSIRAHRDMIVAMDAQTEIDETFGRATSVVNLLSGIAFGVGLVYFALAGN